MTVKCDALRVQVIERFVASKQPSSPSLDVLVVADPWIGVADRSTPESPHEPLLLEVITDPTRLEFTLAKGQQHDAVCFDERSSSSVEFPQVDR